VFEEKKRQLNRAVTALDVISSVVAFIIAYFSHRILADHLTFLRPPDFYVQFSLLPLFLASLLYFLSSFGAYRQPRGAAFYHYIIALIKATLASLVILFTIIFIFKIEYVSRPFIALFSTINFIQLTIIRYFFIQYFYASYKSGKNVLQILIVGTGPRAQLISKRLGEEVNWGFKILGYLDPDPSFHGPAIGAERLIGSVMDIHKILKRNVVDEVIIAIPRSMIESVEYVFYACEEEGVRVRFMADFFDFRVARVRVVDLAEIPLLTLEPIAQDEIKLLTKRTIDLVLTILSMPLVLILTAIIAIAIKFDGPGPVFFVQERVGLKKRRFQMYKFRSMVPNAEALMKDIEDLNEAEGPNFKITEDPRVTRVGRFLRRTSLDELPQLFNVIKGDMSIVGPRPMSIRDVDLFDKGIQRKRFSVKPGVTCLWQISGRSDLSFSEWLELDLKYINNWSLSLDFLIMLKTFPAVILRKGAV
jgi:exopolysaccharide biosynthesis polyprenyl glycosylphosphotransferase